MFSILQSMKFQKLQQQRKLLVCSFSIAEHKRILQYFRVSPEVEEKMLENIAELFAVIFDFHVLFYIQWKHLNF